MNEYQLRMNSIRGRLRIIIASLSVLAALLSLSTTASGQYNGAGANAAWRGTAATMIDANRKADLAVNVRYSDGTLIQGATVDVQMQRHEFQFGSSLDARYFLPSQSQYNATYAALIPQLFNVATFENHLKWRAWDGNFGASFLPNVSQAGLDWLGARDIDVRGHAMMWPRYESVPNSIRTILDIANPSQSDLQNLHDATFDHINDIGPAVAGKVFAWDMLNEPRTSDDIENALVGFTPAGQPTIQSVADLRARWFNAAQAADTDATMFVNDYDILPGGDGSRPSRNQFNNRVNQMLAAGAPIDGLGFQSHFNPTITGKIPTGIPKVLDLLDDFQSDFGDLPVHITEFDFNSPDATLQANYTRDFMTAVFAHESVDAFVMWNFWAGKTNRPDAVLFNLDGSPRPNGQVYLDLVFDDWWTDETGTSNASGDFLVRGFKGDYQVSVDINGNTIVFDEVLSDGGAALDVIVQRGDFDINGAFECADVDALVAEIAAGTGDSWFDLNGDGSVTSADLDAWLATAGAGNLASGNSYLPGDANLDGTVNMADFDVWNANRFTNLAAWCSADFNADGHVDVSDFNIWLSNNSQSVVAVTVPEPHGILWLLLSLACFSRRTRSSR